MQQLCSAREIAAGTLSIPHPYPDGAAAEWISSRGREEPRFAIERREDAALVGAIGLRVEPDHARAELGYWVGVPYWNRGYATEAAAAVVRYGFEQLGLERIYAHHFVANPPSGRVLQKIGMRHEGTLRRHVLKWGERLDLEAYAVLRSE